METRDQIQLKDKKYLLPWDCIVCKASGEALISHKSGTIPITDYFKISIDALTASHSRVSPNCLASKDPEEAVKRAGGTILRFLNIGLQKEVHDKPNTSG